MLFFKDCVYSLVVPIKHSTKPSCRNDSFVIVSLYMISFVPGVLSKLLSFDSCLIGLAMEDQTKVPFAID